MANQPHAGGSKDDDSWGKLASDLLGIQFGAAEDDDFDLTEDEPVQAKPAQTAPAAVECVAARADEPDVSFPEDEEPAPSRTPMMAAEPLESTPEAVESPNEVRSDQRDESEKDIWDLLESWNWDEPNRESSRARSEEGSQSGSRSEGRSSSDRRDRGPRRERTRDRGERPAPQDSETRESRPPRREERPGRDRQRSERGDRGDKGERPPRISERPAATQSDEFAAGLDEPVSRPKSPERQRPSRRPTPAPRIERADSDDFAGDLFAEPEIEDLADDEGTSEGSETDREESSEEPRRRRRRRRRGRSRREEGVRDVEPLESIEDDAEESEPEPVNASEDDSGEESEEREARRPRRRRRRVRRRVEEQVEQHAIEDESDEGNFEEQVTDSEDTEEEVVVPVSYEGIPSWEEAISYLQRRPRESRSRGEGSRGRGGPQRR